MCAGQHRSRTRQQRVLSASQTQRLKEDCGCHVPQVHAREAVTDRLRWYAHPTPVSTDSERLPGDRPARSVSCVIARAQSLDSRPGNRNRPARHGIETIPQRHATTLPSRSHDTCARRPSSRAAAGASPLSPQTRDASFPAGPSGWTPRPASHRVMPRKPAASCQCLPSCAPTT